MGRRKREPMSEGKRNIITGLLQEYDIKTAKDIEDALKDLLSGTIQKMLEAEMDEHLGYSSYERSDNTDYRNGKKTKKIRGNFGETEIEVRRIVTEALSLRSYRSVRRTFRALNRR